MKKILSDFNDTAIIEVQSLPAANGNKLTWKQRAEEKQADNPPEAAEKEADNLEELPEKAQTSSSSDDEEFIMVDTDIVLPPV